MKEYIAEVNGKWRLVESHELVAGRIEVPEGAEIFAVHERCSAFYRKKGVLLEYFEDDVWKLGGYSSSNYKDEMARLGRVVLWQRSLNDKVASAEVARQELKGVEATLAERESTYGSFTQVANTTGQLMVVILNSPNGHTMPYAHEEALHMICSKIARIVNGDINHADSWHDIGGYAKLIEDIIQGEAS